MVKYGFICSFANPPNEEYECLEAIVSQGKSCRKCLVLCYRQGMDAKEATADNKKLVARKRSAVTQKIPL